MGKRLKDQKSETITIHLTARVREEADKLYEEYGANTTRSAYFGQIMELGLQVEKLRQKQLQQLLERLAEPHKSKLREMYDSLDSISQHNLDTQIRSLIQAAHINEHQHNRLADSPAPPGADAAPEKEAADF
jgi:hypothetical protein